MATSLTPLTQLLRNEMRTSNDVRIAQQIMDGLTWPQKEALAKAVGKPIVVDAWAMMYAPLPVSDAPKGIMHNGTEITLGDHSGTKRLALKHI